MNHIRITGYDIGKFLNDYVTFTNRYYSSIVNYYNGGDIDQDAFNFLDHLRAEEDKIKGIWPLYTNVFNNTDFWELLDTFDSISIKLDTVENLGKWLRSSRSGRFSTNTKTTYVQKQGESIENIISKLGSFDPENDWVKLSIQNDLNEEKYTSQGGVLLMASLSNNLNFDIKNIVDGLSKENLYGKDIQKKFVFTDGDLITLKGENSLLQTIETFLTTNKGSIIEFPEDGLENYGAGSNVNAFSYPSIFRNLLSMVQKDDRFQALVLVDLFREDDSIFIKLNFMTKLGQEFKKALAI